jgi:hypothetical protein
MAKKYTYVEDGKHKAGTLVIDNAEDVTVTDPDTGEALVWNGSEWVNGEPDIDGGTFI